MLYLWNRGPGTWLLLTSSSVKGNTLAAAAVAACESQQDGRGSRPAAAGEMWPGYAGNFAKHQCTVWSRCSTCTSTQYSRLLYTNSKPRHDCMTTRCLPAASKSSHSADTRLCIDTQQCGGRQVHFQGYWSNFESAESSPLHDTSRHCNDVSTSKCSKRVCVRTACYDVLGDPNTQSMHALSSTAAASCSKARRSIYDMSCRLAHPRLNDLVAGVISMRMASSAGPAETSHTQPHCGKLHT